MRYKFQLWCRYYFPGYFMDDAKVQVIADAPFHEEMDINTVRVYRGNQLVFLDADFRGAAKTTRKKLFLGFVLGNDLDHFRRYIKILSEDIKNAQQIVVDVYNMYADPAVKRAYPEVFEKTPEKREETRPAFETAQNVRVTAGTVGMAQRGHVQDEYRPDFIWYDDFENRKTLRSAVVTQSVWDNMEEARTGLSRSGGAIYTCNYLSERGNVHKLLEKHHEHTLIIPITGRVELLTSGETVSAVWHEEGGPTWPAAYTPEHVARILEAADDPAGDYLSAPAAGDDVYMERAKLDKQERKKPVRNIGGFEIFHEYVPGHTYAGGHDVGGGVGLDYHASVFVDFTTYPARVVATYKDNRITPIEFGDEIVAQGDIFGRCLVAPENNKFDACIGRIREHAYENIFIMPDPERRAGAPTRTRQYGWNTNTLTKSTMLQRLRKWISNGWLELSDPELIAEARALTRDDVMDRDLDPRLTKRHFDKLMAAAIAVMMHEHAGSHTPSATYEQGPYEPTSEYEGGGTSEGDTIQPRPIYPEEQGTASDYQQPPYEGQSDFET